MGKHLGLKAFVLLVVIFFHSIVLTPKIHAGTMGTVIDIAVARQALRTIAPTVVKATPAGWGYALAYMGIAAAAYIFIKSGAVTGIKNWLDSTLDPQLIPPPPWGTYNTWSAATGSWQFRTTQNGPSCTYFQVNSNTGYGWPSGTQGQWMVYSSCASAGDIASFVASHGGSAIPPPPSVPTDYGLPGGLLETSVPTWPDHSVFFTPGAADLLTGANSPIGGTPMTDADIDKAVSALGANEVDSSGVQPRPNTNDNTLSADANASIPYLQQIMNYVSNLIGIKSDTGFIKTNTDNLVAGQAAQTSAVNQSLGKLDNIAIASQAMKGTMDNVGIAINNQTVAIEQILDKLDNVVNALKESTASQSSLSSRVSEVKDLLLSKFPFSIVAAVTSPGAVTGGTYTIPDLQFPMGTSVSVDPLANDEIHSWVTWLRGLMSVGMWAIFVLVMVRRVTEI